MTEMGFFRQSGRRKARNNPAMKAKEALPIETMGDLIPIVGATFLSVPSISSGIYARGEHLPYRFLIFLSSFPGEQSKVIGLCFPHLLLSLCLLLFKRWQFFRGNLTDGFSPNLCFAPSLSRASKVWLEAAEQWHFITQSKTSALLTWKLYVTDISVWMSDGACSSFKSERLFYTNGLCFCFSSFSHSLPSSRLSFSSRLNQTSPHSYRSERDAPSERSLIAKVLSFLGAPNWEFVKTFQRFLPI